LTSGSSVHRFSKFSCLFRAAHGWYGAGVYGNNPNPGHEIYIFDLQKRAVDGVIGG
jgi:hypothetical protein